MLHLRGFLILPPISQMLHLQVFLFHHLQEEPRYHSPLFLSPLHPIHQLETHLLCHTYLLLSLSHPLLQASLSLPLLQVLHSLHSLPLLQEPMHHLYHHSPLQHT